jgi:hypothetical protein
MRFVLVFFLWGRQPAGHTVMQAGHTVTQAGQSDRARLNSKALLASMLGPPTEVDDLALGVEVVQGHERLPHQVTHNGDGDAAVAVHPAGHAQQSWA